MWIIVIVIYLVSFYGISLVQDKLQMAVLCVFSLKKVKKRFYRWVLFHSQWVRIQHSLNHVVWNCCFLQTCYDVNSSASFVSFVILAFPLLCTIILNLPLYFLFSSCSLKNARALKSPWHFRVFVRDLGQRLSLSRFFRYPHLSTQSSEITTALKADKGLFVLSQHKAGLHVQ